MALLFARKTRRIKRLLIVEDEPLVAFDNEHFLRDQGYEVVATVDRVAPALDQIARGGVDLVLVDLRLAGEDDGTDVARAAHGQGIPVLFVTGHCSESARPYGVGCLGKPYSQRDLHRSIEIVGAHLAGQPVGRKPGALTLFP